jgi:hypothetical protein
MVDSPVKSRSKLSLRSCVRDGEEFEGEERDGLYLELLDDEGNQDLEGPVSRRRTLLAEQGEWREKECGSTNKKGPFVHPNLPRPRTALLVIVPGGSFV